MDPTRESIQLRNDLVNKSQENSFYQTCTIRNAKDNSSGKRKMLSERNFDVHKNEDLWEW